jgi:hypothetical protein
VQRRGVDIGAQLRALGRVVRPAHARVNSA